MYCTEFKNSLIDFCENSLSSEKKSEMEIHAQTCAACSKILINVNSLFLQLETEKREEANPYFVNVILAKANFEKEHKKQIPDWLFAMPNRIITAVLAFGIITGVVLSVLLLPVDVVTQVNNDEMKNELVSDNDNAILTLNDE